MDFASTHGTAGGGNAASVYAEGYAARLRAALVPFALVAVAVLGLRGQALSRARGRNRAVAVKLGLLADGEAVAALRRALGGIGGLLAWERRATRVAGQMGWQLRTRARGMARKEEKARERGGEAADDVFAAIEAELRGGGWGAWAAGGAPEGREDVKAAPADDGIMPRREGVRYALPSLPTVVWKDVPRRVGGRSASRGRAARLRVTVWPEEVMSARENAAQGERRARRLGKLDGRSWMEAERREGAVRRDDDLGESAEAMRARWAREAREAVGRYRAARAMREAGSAREPP